MHAAVADNSITRTLALASRSVGGLPRLAEYLGVAEALLQEWLEGKRDPPTLMREGARQEEMTSHSPHVRVTDERRAAGSERRSA
jgi:hypothetical protein